MSAPDRLNSLLLFWQEQHDQGRDLSATELSRDCPELEPELREQIRILRDMNALLGSEQASPACAENTGDLLPTLEQRAADGGPPGPRPVQVPGYEIIKELGTGGMGKVYLARQTRLGRLVALKMVLGGGHARSDDLTRFRTEGEAVARLQHPNIVQVFEVGEHEGLPYFSLELCPGGSLDRKLAGSPLPPEEAARLVEPLARAMQAAHQASVIHRDLKPANVLLAADGTPKVTDFGLARKLDEAGQTRTGSVMGTPSYMAPEQALAQKAIGPPADVYALGAILYECLTGRPPFKADTLYDTMMQVIDQEPVPPRQLNAKVPLDLETITLKCLEKDPARRYGSAGELAEDLRSFLQGEPIRARPTGWMGRTLKWVKRRPAMAALSAVCVLAGVALLGLGFWFSAEMGAAGVALKAKEERARDAERLAQTHEFFGLLREIEKRAVQRNPGWTWANHDDLVKAAALAPAGQHLVNLRSEAASALGSIDVRRRPAVKEGFDAASLAFHPDGRRLALGQLRATGWAMLSVVLIDPRTGETTATLTTPVNALASLSAGGQDGIYALAFSPDGRWLVAGTRYGALHRWDLTQSPPALASWTGHQKEVSALCFARSGKALYSGSNREKSVLRWPVSAWTRPVGNLKPESRFTAEATIGSPVAHPAPLASSPTEGWLACTSADSRLHFLSEETLQPLSPHLPGLGDGLLFLTDGNTLVFEKSSQLHFLNLRTRQVMRSLSPPDSGHGVPSPITDLVLSPDGALLASASDQSKHVLLWEVPTGRLLADLHAGSGRLKMAFSPDGRTLAVTAERKTLLYEIGGLREQTFVASSPQPILTGALHPDGRSLACLAVSLWGEGARDVTVWPLGAAAAVQPAARHTLSMGSEEEPSLNFHPRSQALAFSAGGKVLLQDSAGRTEPVVIPNVKNAALSFSTEGWLWGAVEDTVRTWDERGREAGVWSNRLGRVLTGKAGIHTVAAGRQWAAAGGRDGQVHLFRASDASRHSGVAASQAPVGAVALNGSETLVAAGSEQGDLCLLRVPAGNADEANLAVSQAATPHSDRVTAVSWSGDRLLASGSRDRTVKLWSCADGGLRELLTLRQPAPVRWLAFHPDAVRLFVLLEGERAVRVWHLDQVIARLKEMGLGADLEPIAPVPLPPAAANPPPPEPVAETPRSPNGLKAELFAGMDFQRLVKVRHDAQVSWGWGINGPDPLLGADCFSIRWTGWLKAPRPGRYTLRLYCDDGGKLWLDDKLVIDLWQKSGPTPYQVDVELTGQPQELRVEYFQQFGDAFIHLSWAQQGGFGMQSVPPWAVFHDRAAAEKAIGPPIAFLPERRSTAAEALQARRVWAEHLGLKEEEEIDLGGGVKMKLMFIPPGKFLMGSNPAEGSRAHGEHVQHEVEITRPYYLGAFLVTQAQYEKVMGKNPAHFTKEKGGGPEHPVEMVSWEEAVKFCEELSRLRPGGGRRFRLPTEAEWEYACREAGSSQTPFHYGNSLSSRQANFNGNFPFGGAPKDIYREKTTPVGTFKPNSLGLFDMHGNLWQWCGDYLHDYDLTRTTDPFRNDKSEYCVLRGGSWKDSGEGCRAAGRTGNFPNTRSYLFGFRVVLVVGATTP
jgi:formylglycine-generating enzyme required for sulfatase activity/WD40 repeat protein